MNEALSAEGEEGASGIGPSFFDTFLLRLGRTIQSGLFFWRPLSINKREIELEAFFPWKKHIYSSLRLVIYDISKD